MLYNDCVIVIDDPKDKHDFSADTRIGKVIVNLARIAKTDEEPEPDIYRKIAVANGCLPHEIFHMIITLLKQEELADERMIINLKNGLQITARGMVGFMLNEGFVEKFSSEFAERNGLYHQIAPQYLPYVDICNFIMEHHEDVNENTIFSLEAHEIILRLTPEEQQEYYDAETISYAVRHRDLNADDIANTKIQIEELPYKISPERKKELMNYMLLKEQKFEETVALPTSRRRLF